MKPSVAGQARRRDLTAERDRGKALLAGALGQDEPAFLSRADPQVQDVQPSHSWER